MLDLAIVLITYNRSTYLRRTLDALSRSVFRSCDIWILNNASTDDTLAVCNEFKSIFLNMHIVTHRFNIGGNANIMRAYEYGNRYYTWILCDDDILQLEEIDDLVHVLKQKECDLIRLSDVGVLEQERGKVQSVATLLHDPDSFSFYSFGFVPGIIFKQEAIGPNVQFGYQNQHTAYPQLFVLMKAFGTDSLVYTTNKSLLNRGDAPMAIGSEILWYQIQSLGALPTKRSRDIALSWRRKRQNILGYLSGYGRLILSDLRFGRPRSRIFSIWVRTVAAAPSLSGKLILFINGIFILTPIRPVYLLLRRRKMDQRSYPDR